MFSVLRWIRVGQSNARPTSLRQQYVLTLFPAKPCQIASAIVQT